MTLPRLTSFSAWTTGCTEMMEMVLWSGLISLGSVLGIDTDSRHLHIRSTLIMCIYFTQMEADLLSVLLLKVVIICLFCYSRASSFLNIRILTIPTWARPLLPEDLFPHIAFPFSITKVSQGRMARWADTPEWWHFCVHGVCEDVGVCLLTSPEIDGLNFPRDLRKPWNNKPTTLCAL